MPNWTYNEVTLTSDKETIAKVKKLLGKKFDFNKVKPMPIEIRKQCIYHDENDDSTDYIVIDGIAYVAGTTPERLTELKEKYGYSNWYDFNRVEWGTKWNAKNVELLEETEERLLYTFDTAWYAPHPIMEELVRKFPNLHIEMRSEYEDGGHVEIYNFNEEEA